VELGGTDQTFNLLLGRDVQRAYGVPEQAVLTMPILPGTDGVEKMSKSLGNHIGVTESPDEIFGKTLSVPDDVMHAFFSLLAVDPPPEGVSPRDAKRALALALVERFHSEQAAAEARDRFDKVFIARELPDEIPEIAVAAANGTVHVPALVSKAFGHSSSEARRLIAAGGVKVGGEPVSELDVAAADLDGAVVQVGKRHFARVRVEG
jgi:tyrosyl-tRNA synthetase